METKIYLCKRFMDILRQHDYTDTQICSFARCLSRKFIDLEKLNNLMKETSQVAFNYDPETKIFELVDPFNLMGIENHKITMTNFKEQ